MIICEMYNGEPLCVEMDDSVISVCNGYDVMRNSPPDLKITWHYGNFDEGSIDMINNILKSKRRTKLIDDMLC